jgi:acyl carrier protein
MNVSDIVTRIESIFERIGVYVEEFDSEYLVEDFILDSLAYISFYIEIENEFNVEFSDEVYVVDVSEFKIVEFAERIILPLLQESNQEQ